MLHRSTLFPLAFVAFLRPVTRVLRDPGPATTFGITLLAGTHETTPPRPHLVRFGDLRAVQQLSDGRMLVLDKPTNTIDVYSTKMRFLFSLPKRADGRRIIPPKAFAISESNVVATLELTGQAISLYRITPTAAEIIRSIELPGAPTSICSIGHNFFVHLNESDRSIHEISERGQLSVGFKAGLPANVPPLGKFYYNADLSCVPDADEIILYSAGFPQLDAYSTSGRHLWRGRLKLFRPLPLIQRPDGGLQTPLEGAISDHIVSSVLVSSSVIAIQIRTLKKIGSAENPANPPQTRFVDVYSGREIGGSATLPLIAHATEKRLFTFDAVKGSIIAHEFATTHTR